MQTLGCARYSCVIHLGGQSWSPVLTEATPSVLTDNWGVVKERVVYATPNWSQSLKIGRFFHLLLKLEWTQNTFF